MAQIDVHPFRGRELVINPTGEKPYLNGQLESYVKEQWVKKRNTWTSSWIPMITKLEYSNGNVEIYAGSMTYMQAIGCIEAMEEGQDFAPRHGFVNNLSIGIFPLTEDGYVIFTRRTDSVRVPGVWNASGGYLTSRHLVKDMKEAEKEEFSKPGSQIYNFKLQAMLRLLNQEFRGLGEEDIKLEKPDALAIGYGQSKEPEIGMVARLRGKMSQMREHMRRYEFAPGKIEHDDVAVIPIEELRRLLEFQERLPLASSGGRRHRWEIPLLDVNRGELIGGVYERLTGDHVADIAYGMEENGQINQYPAHPGFSRAFLTSY